MHSCIVLLRCMDASLLTSAEHCRVTTGLQRGWDSFYDYPVIRLHRIDIKNC